MLAMSWRGAGVAVVLAAIALLGVGLSGYIVQQIEQEHGPRIVFQGFQADTRGSNDELIVRSLSAGDVDITAAALSAELVTSTYPDTVRNPDVSGAQERVRASLARARMWDDSAKFRRGAVVQSDRFIVPHSDVKAALSGKLFMYIVFMAKYTDRNTPVGKVWVTETCNDIVIPYTDFQPCAGFPDARYLADGALRPME